MGNAEPRREGAGFEMLRCEGCGHEYTRRPKPGSWPLPCHRCRSRAWRAYALELGPGRLVSVPTQSELS